MEKRTSVHCFIRNDRAVGTRVNETKWDSLTKFCSSWSLSHSMNNSAILTLNSSCDWLKKEYKGMIVWWTLELVK